MKKLLLFIVLFGAMSTIVSCEKVAENPGDYDLKATLELGSVVTSIGGTEYPLTVSREIDTTYRYSYTENDTTKDANGDPVIGEDGNLIIRTDTLWYTGITSARYIEMEPILLPSTADTFSIKLTSNARWRAPLPSAGTGVQWYFSYNITTGGTSLTGGGDSEVDFRVTRNRGRQRAVTAVQYIFTSDSTVMYKLQFNQSGERD